MMRRLACVVWAICLFTACDDGGSAAGDAAVDAAPPVAEGPPLLSRVRVGIPIGAGPGLRAAAEDFETASTIISGARPPAASRRTGVVNAVVDPAHAAELGQQGFRIEVVPASGSLRVIGATEVGAMYGLYTVIADMGVRYHHPEETFYPRNVEARLPWDYDGTPQKPRFALRGFHEHTQHPIVMSDVYLRPEAQLRPYLSHYIRWMARNRQNAMSWHMLKTVDLDAWLPYIGGAVDEAHGFGIRVGMVLSFVDQQQNNFKVIREDVAADDETQIRDTLDRLAAAGFDFFAFQIGSSEFTKPADADVLRWLGVAADHLGALSPPVKMYAWIHTTCDLHTDDGGYFYHLPLQAPASVGAWVHTTMFYTLTHPAPVYSCEDFSQQADFLTQADGQREQVYFPETAWWLGFDNNVPLALPLYGWSRAHDIQAALAPHEVAGHITFTSGREWSYWQYDHFLTRATWDAETTWESYLDWIAPLYGDAGAAVAEVTRAFTDLQRRHFYEESPLLWFYVAGELPQDEVGEQAGILARRPKPAFNAVLRMEDDAFAAWEAGDLAALRRMHGEYAEAFAALPAPAAGEGQSVKLHAEAYDGFRLFVLRLEHAVALYEATAQARRWAKLRAGAAPDEASLAAARAEAEARLAAAQAISEDVLATVTAAEARYRYPVELLARDKPETLTSYPYGYLAETSTAYFWIRRDEQAAALLAEVFDTPPDAWPEAPGVVYRSDGERADLLVPENPLAENVLTGFIPQILFGVSGLEGESAALQVALDHNRNRLPDASRASRVALAVDGDGWAGTTEVFTIEARRSTGERFGELDLLDATFRLRGEVDALATADLEGQIDRDAFIGLVTTIAGLDVQGVTTLLKGIFGVPAGEDLPERLPVAFRFALEQVAE